MAEVHSVSQVNKFIKNMFAREYVLNHICVKGEVSNCKYHSSGHIYFTIKDKDAALSCVMFASMRRGLAFRLEEGQSILVTGSISVYERSGSYQLYANKITLDGAGGLYEQFERLKKQLLEEGLFDSERKKAIPKYASKIGVVTSETGAVIQDICNVSARRNPYIQLYLYPSKVQGEGAENTVIEGIHYFDHTDVDVIIIGRGGGSIEDLAPFNTESLARAIAACKKPIISAVGHETDVTIADYAADLRAPTPSAAAELAVYSLQDVELLLRGEEKELKRQMNQVLREKRRVVKYYEDMLSSLSPLDRVRQMRLRLVDQENRMQMLMEKRVTSYRHQLSLYVEELKGLSPLNRLESGYAYLADEEKNQIHGVKEMKKGQKILAVMRDGVAELSVLDIKEEDR